MVKPHTFIPHFDPVAYASRGTTILGIRDTGKSYLAQKLGEKLFDAGIPWVAFDPIGVWRWMRVPGKHRGGRGYPVVVAGGVDGDLSLTPDTAPKIVRAAMEKGVSLVIDLYSFDLSKADHRRIVEACVRVLLYENGKFGLRHIFIEEAAEFVPQRVGPDQGKVYAIMEALARMGGNARLGYTLINQRGEQVNKAVVELCDNLLLFRQKGRNSITALSKWLDVADTAGAKEVIKTLATLPQGECWAWMAGSDRPVLVKVPSKNSFHPDRRAVGATIEAGKRVGNTDSASFIATMREALEKKPAPKVAYAAKTVQLGAVNVADARRTARERLQLESLAKAERAAEYRRGYGEGYELGYSKGLDALRASFARIEAAVAAFKERDARLPPPELKFPKTVIDKSLPAGHVGLKNGKGETVPVKLPTVEREGISTPQTRILDAIAWLNAIIPGSKPPRVTVAFLSGASPDSSQFSNNLGALRSAGMLDYPEPGKVALTAAGAHMATPLDLPQDGAALRLAIADRLQPTLRRMFSTICNAYPEALGREDLAQAVEASASSSQFSNNLGRLRSLGLIDYPERGTVKAKEEIFP